MTMNRGEQIGALAASLEQAGLKNEEINKKREVIARELDALCNEKGCVEFEQDGLQANLQRAKHARDRYAEAVNRVKIYVGNLLKLVAEDASALQHLG